jgi:uncharacterized SAM-binding protein YcdF (DUF218 family)
MLFVLELITLLTPVPEYIENRLSVATDPPAKADVIVCLGGGFGRETRAAQLWHRGVAPVIVVSNVPGAAQWMRNFIADCGVPRSRILVDETSSNTAAHPAGVARLPGIDPARQHFVLVTSFEHSRRAKAVFLKAGYRHVDVFAGYRVRDPNRGYLELVKSRIMNGPSILYELAGLIQYQWQGKI